MVVINNMCHNGFTCHDRPEGGGGRGGGGGVLSVCVGGRRVRGRMRLGGRGVHLVTQAMDAWPQVMDA